MDNGLQDRPGGLDTAATRRRHLDQQVAALEDFERRLAQRVHAARTTPGRADTVRELLSRLRGVRARLQEAQLARADAAEAESRLRGDAAQREAQLEQARREADEREAFYLACLNAPSVARNDTLLSS